ncbi:MAG: hypothetical protein IKV59_07180, partial [Lachnospiraceae bacterium]|nr:hypothetical protein [Lachnospiraceae bacterium]
MKKSRLWKKKGYRYGALRFLSLVMAVVLFLPYALEVVQATSVGSGPDSAGDVGTGTQTDTLDLGNGISITLEKDDSGNYLIKEAAHVSKLGQATSGTSGMTFVLNNDITIPSITSAAAGMFEGTFEGNGKVITIQDINITDNTSGEVSQGLLFGTVSGSGKVQNLIVDIKDENASYTRVSKVEHGAAEGSPEVNVLTEAQAPYVG